EKEVNGRGVCFRLKVVICENRTYGGVRGALAGLQSRQPPTIMFSWGDFSILFVI
ncbi:unnamed protein product, partial [marine sediment metagenome]